MLPFDYGLVIHSRPNKGRALLIDSAEGNVRRIEFKAMIGREETTAVLSRLFSEPRYSNDEI